MPEPLSQPPQWRFTAPGVRVVFVGRCTPGADRAVALAEIEPNAPPVSGARQVHGAEVLEGRAGICGEGDALVTAESRLAVSVITADCVPVMLAAGERIAAVHAGWRGLVAGVIPAAIGRLLADEAAGEQAAAWIGPAIGSCCYEVDADVADQVEEAAGTGVRRTERIKPHLDLQLAARLQLERLGVVVAGTVDRCTRCHPEELWSFRRDGPRAGRNIAYIWRTG